MPVCAGFGEMHVAPSVTRFLEQHRRVHINLLLLDRVVNLLDKGIDLAVRIAHLDDSVQVMDSLTYRTFELLKNRLEHNIDPGKSINAILIDGAVFVSFYLPEFTLTS